MKEPIPTLELESTLLSNKQLEMLLMQASEIGDMNLCKRIKERINMKIENESETIKPLLNSGWVVEDEDETTRKYEANKQAMVKFYSLSKGDKGIYMEIGPVDYIVPDRRFDNDD